jgi:hypothetical protein
MFECLIGWPPFCAEEAHDTYRKIVDWQRHLHFPPDQQLGGEAEDFIRRYVRSRPYSRNYILTPQTASYATQRTVSAVSVAVMRSNSTPSSAVCNGTAFVASARPSNPSCNPMSTHSTSPLTRSRRRTQVPCFARKRPRRAMMSARR